jgi:hypothetical protein
MKRITNNISGLAIIFLFAILALSCEKDKEETFTPDRIFTPGRISATSGETNAKLEWSSSLYLTDSATYIVEVGKDSLLTGTIDYTTETKALSLNITDKNIQIKTKYFARIKAKGQGTAAESKWEYSPSFGIKGEQIFLNVNDADLKDKSALLKWRTMPGLTKIVLTPAMGAPIDVPLDPADVTAMQKLITGLTPKMAYLAEIFQGTLSKGITGFITKEPSIYAVILSPGDDLVSAVANAANGDVIGLEQGTYSCVDNAAAYVNLVIAQKSITIQSISGDPTKTKVNFKEITLKGTGAGVTLKGIEFDGAPANATSAQALYFLNLVGMASDAEAATFTNIIVDNCIIHNIGNCLLRGNRAATNAHKIGTMRFNNSRIYDCLFLNAYTFFTIEKLEFTKLELTNSTFYNLGRAVIGWSTSITVGTPPSILIDQCTINNWGRDARNNFFIDAITNPVIITIQNSIIANTPYTGQTTGTTLVRASAAVTSTLAYTNTFKLTNGASPAVALTFPAILTPQNNKTIDLGWDGTTTNFTLPVGSELRTSSSTGGPVGDLRWAQ